MTITITADGLIEFVYDDALVGLLAAGEATVRRVSHVEPSPGGWTAEMIDGPVLGPFVLRADALAAERAWLATERGL